MRGRTVVAIALSVGIAVAAATGVNYASASSSVPQSAPAMQDADASAPLGGDGGQTDFNNRHRNDDEGRVFVNERTYSADPGVCTAVISSPATSFNVRNESNKTIEFFTGITCDNGAAIATIGPRNSSSVIPGTTVFDGAVVPFALVGSFRAVDNKHH
ncbi:predicted protein [Streptomyces viridochromogenes DSM 40736]|uniref:Predicted protein n=1 Tax=Streptomyces viridochromogenes (strain DSM 40736 / JCM 4977 / BCRC 1201 / Tue 494) TaxID=591159 RepID=D9XGG2_STRVT|nr:hypothetical protein [Streptomyces viridochromogenes]EFL37051.1 predicted protein [Streptomyces viridochromogenes DSM 40736]